MILELIKKYWWDAALILAVVVLQTALLLKSREADLYKAERDAARTLVVTMSDQIEDQNAGIQALADVAKQNRDVYLAGLKAAEKRATRLTVEAEDILALPTPTNPDEACVAAAGVLEGVTR
jgi:hypothetical protein